MIIAIYPGTFDPITYGHIDGSGSMNQSTTQEGET